MHGGRFGGGAGSNVDDFIANEMQQIEATGAPDQAKPTMRPSGMSGSGAKSLSSKPNFGISAGKKPGGAFAKPGFAMMGPKKTVGGAGAGPTVISKGSFNPIGGGGPPKMNFSRKR